MQVDQQAAQLSSLLPIVHALFTALHSEHFQCEYCVFIGKNEVHAFAKNPILISSKNFRLEEVFQIIY